MNDDPEDERAKARSAQGLTREELQDIRKELPDPSRGGYRGSTTLDPLHSINDAIEFQFASSCFRFRFRLGSMRYLICKVVCCLCTA